MTRWPAVAIVGASKWYGQVLGVSHVDLRVERGIVGLLGPNGAGKSTLMKLLVGLLAPSVGEVRLFGQPVFHTPGVRRRLGYCPEHEGIYEEMSALEFVAFMAELSGVPRGDSKRRASEALDALGLADAMHRRLGGYSKGMRQRAKLAQAFVHDPDVVVLDEPLTGCDPVARTKIVNRIRELASDKVVLVSSHVLYEIENLTSDIFMMFRGKLVAEGDVHRLRELIDEHPHRIRVTCDVPRVLAQLLVTAPHVTRVSVDDASSTVEIETHDPDTAYDQVRDAALDGNVNVAALMSPDDNLEAVFRYLTGGAS